MSTAALLIRLDAYDDIYTVHPPHSLLQTHTHTHTHTQSQSHYLTLTHTHTHHSLSLSHTHTHTISLTHTLSLCLTHTHTISLTLTHDLSLSHTPTHTHTPPHTHTQKPNNPCLFFQFYAILRTSHLRYRFHMFKPLGWRSPERNQQFGSEQTVPSCFTSYRSVCSNSVSQGWPWLLLKPKTKTSLHMLPKVLAAGYR